MKFSLIRGKDCKHSVVYEAPPGVDAKTLPARSIYIQRSAFPQGMPSVIEVEIKASQSSPNQVSTPSSQPAPPRV